jgi:hypothetical protein
MVTPVSQAIERAKADIEDRELESKGRKTNWKTWGGNKVQAWESLFGDGDVSTLEGTFRGREDSTVKDEYIFEN